MFIGAKTLIVNGTNEGHVSSIKAVLPEGVELIPAGFCGPWVFRMHNGKTYTASNIKFLTIYCDDVISIEEEV